jgi:hypothetical protein
MIKQVAFSVVFAGLAASLASAATGDVTFTKDVAPILQRACQNCHRSGSIAPMSLLTYQDARPWARSIKEKVIKRQMPPWHIDRNVGITKFKDDPSLSDAEIKTIAAWVDQGSPEGNPKDMPPPRQFTDLDKWHIKPDIIVKMPKPYVLKAKGGDEYYDIDVDPGFTEDMYVQAVETKPDTGFRVVHHADTNLIEDEDDPVGLFLNEYAVGKNADIFPANAGRLVKAGSKIHFNLHLHPDGEPTPVQISVGLQLYPKGKAPKYVALTQHMGNSVPDLDIPAGQVVRSDGYFRLPKPAMISAFQPHFHLRGKAQCMEAIYPDVRIDTARPGPARSEMISCVSDYQFGWSMSYPYADDAAPLLPAGTVIHVTTWHDNTDRNPHNPNPKNWVGFGQRTIDEMGFAWVSLYYLDDADYQQRVAERRAKTGSE